MDHPLGVGVGDRLAHLLEDPHELRPPLPGPAASQQRRQGPALDQLHGEERPAVGQPAELVDRHDARVRELAADPRLVEEPLDQHRGDARPPTSSP